ncbi:MAG: tRNA (adenosine(37)-N6)-threonylcarbamoyltransferase complex dimerization subunit type 1 TsaB [Alphaproteobacteria bacterium]
MPDDCAYVLAIDSAVRGCGVCVYDTKSPSQSVRRHIDVSRGQAETLIPLVEESMQKSGIGFEQIGLMACTRGPGSFTGVRVGISAAKSYALALSIPLIGVSTLELMARQYYNKQEATPNHLCVLLESKRTEFYCQIFEGNGEAQSAPAALSAQDIGKLCAQDTVFIGDGFARFSKEMDSDFSGQYVEGFEYPDPFILAEMGFECFQNDQNISESIAPLYLRNADVSAPKTLPRQLEK